MNAGIAQTLAKRTLIGLARNSILAVLALAIAAAWAVPALADDDDRIEGTVTVTFMYPSAANYCAASGGDLSIEAQGLGTISGLGPMFLTVKKCFKFSNGTYTGAFTMTARNGDVLSGAYAGSQDPGDENGFGPFQGTLTVKSGTGRFRRARGRLGFTAVASPTSVGVTSPTVTGTAFYLIQGSMTSPDKH